MTARIEILLTETTEDELYAHRLSLDDALSVVDGQDFKTFPDPKHRGRRFIIGRDRGDRLLTLVIEAAKGRRGKAYLITGWTSNKAEHTLFSRTGGNQYEGKAPSPD